MRDHVRHVLAGEHVGKKHDAHDHHRFTETTTGGFEQCDHTGEGDDDIERGRAAGTGGEFAMKNENVTGAKCGRESEQPVIHRHMVARTFFPHRVGKVDEKNREAQVNRARHGVVEHDEFLQRGRGGGHPERHR